LPGSATTSTQTHTSRTGTRSPARARILEAARELFSARGPESVTVGEVAQRAGVARGTVFNQFGSKNGLVEAITEAVLDGYVALLDDALAARSDSVPELVRSLFLAMGRGIEENRRFYSAVFREIARIAVGLEAGGVAQRARVLAVERLEHLLTRGQARGELLRDLDPQHLAVAFDSLVFGTITHWLYENDGSESLPERMLRAADVLLGPVAAEHARTGEGSFESVLPPRTPHGTVGRTKG
jgi:AcrR family transcriptional regulator